MPVGTCWLKSSFCPHVKGALALRGSVSDQIKLNNLTFFLWCRKFPLMTVSHLCKCSLWPCWPNTQTVSLVMTQQGITGLQSPASQSLICWEWGDLNHINHCHFFGINSSVRDLSWHASEVADSLYVKAWIVQPPSKGFIRGCLSLVMPFWLPTAWWLIQCKSVGSWCGCLSFSCHCY